MFSPPALRRFAVKSQAPSLMGLKLRFSATHIVPNGPLDQSNSYAFESLTLETQATTAAACDRGGGAGGDQNSKSTVEFHQLSKLCPSCSSRLHTDVDLFFKGIDAHEYSSKEPCIRADNNNRA